MSPITSVFFLLFPLDVSIFRGSLLISIRMADCQQNGFFEGGDHRYLKEVYESMEGMEVNKMYLGSLKMT